MIEIAGRSTGPGKPLLYTTSGKFMDYFGLRSMEDLPQLKEFLAPAEEIGEPAALDEVVEIPQLKQNGEPHHRSDVDESE